MKLSYKDDLSMFAEAELIKHYWDSEQNIKCKILSKIASNHSKENSEDSKEYRDFLYNVIENETDICCIDNAIFDLERNESTINFLVGYYQKSDNEYLKESVIEKLENISIYKSLDNEKQIVLNKLFRTKYHYAISQDCIIISLAELKLEFQKRIDGNTQEIWVDLKGPFCLHFNSFEKRESNLNFQLLVISKRNNYIPNDCFIPKGWMFMMDIENVYCTENNDFTKTLLRNVKKSVQSNTIL